MQAVPSFTPAQTALLADAVLAGLSFDLQETPTQWVGAKAVAVAPLAVVATALPPPPAPRAMPFAPAPQPAPPPVQAEAPWRVWYTDAVANVAGHVAGNAAGGVVVLLAAEAAPTGAAAALLANMLKAVGLVPETVGFVGLVGLPSKAGQPAAQAALVAAAVALQPTHTLVLGQGVLGVLLGKNLGVEGWQAAPQSLGMAGLCGVTYPLELLLNKPLFKALAWQHLQRWQQGF